MIQASKLAVEHVNAQGGILDGRTLVAVVGDSACSQQGGTDAAAKAVNVEQVVAMVGPYCSGATLDADNTVNIPSAEDRVGNERVGTCQSRGWADRRKKTRS